MLTKQMWLPVVNKVVRVMDDKGADGEQMLDRCIPHGLQLHYPCLMSNVKFGSVSPVNMTCNDVARPFEDISSMAYDGQA